MSRFKPPTPEEEAKIKADKAAREIEDQCRAANVRIGELSRDLGERYSPKRATFDAYSLNGNASQKAAVAKLRSIAASLDQFIADGRGLVLFGSVGTGKDHLAAALLYIAARTVTARWVNGREVFGESRDRMKEERVERELIEKFTAPTVLCISDPVPIIGGQSAWNVDLLYRVLDKRYHAMRPTWMTLNVRDPSDAEERLTPPVWSRLRHGAELIPCFWPDYRESQR